MIITMPDRVCRSWTTYLLLLILLNSPKPALTQSHEVESELGLGKAINIFMRYGYLSICMRVVPRNDSESWVFREPTVNIFKNIEYLEEPQKNEVQSRQTIFDGDFHMEFCDNLKQLLQAYFRDFSFERLDRPWRAFTAGWPQDVLAKNLGINASFTHGDHCYVLVRVARYREKAAMKDLPSDVDVEDVVAEAIENTKDIKDANISDFIKKYGTHYIASYVTGNALYQVFVYTRNVYNRIKDRLKTKGVSDLSTVELGNYFSPWYAEHIGQIKVASGNKTVENWVSKKLRLNYYNIFTHPSLLKLHGDQNLLRTLNNILGNEAMLQLQLKTLAPAFKEPWQKYWFEEMIDNYLKLWESNM